MKKYFITGLVTLLPVAITIWVIHFFVVFLTKPFMGIMTYILSFFSFGPLQTQHGIRILSQVFILIGLFLFILGLGLVARRYFFHRLIRFGDFILFRIPLVNKIYKTSKEIIRSLFSSQGQSFKQVVLVTFPTQGCYCLGLIASDAPQTCSEAADDQLFSVFLPTTPNPTTGYLIMCPKKELQFLSMKSEEAIKYIVSCAVIQPESKESQA